jgi:CheY-like chemotaxis protein
MNWPVAYLLVIDDDADAREVLCAYLRKVGHEAKCAPDGREALGSILARLPDVIILDICMPELDGAGFLKALRSYLGMRSLPVVVLTGVPDSPLVERARILRVSSVLVKGTATPHDVLHAVEEELARDGKQLHRL